MDIKTLYEALKFYSECKAHDPSGVLTRFLPLYYVEVILQKQGLSGQALNDRLLKCFVRLLQKWGESDPEHELTTTDLFWLAHIATDMKLSDFLLSQVVTFSITNDCGDFTKRVKELGLFINPLELAALLLSPSNDLTSPPGHPLWLARGVKNAREWQELGPARIFKDLANVESVIKVFAIALWRAFEHYGASEKVIYDSEYTGLDQTQADYGKTIHNGKKIKNQRLIPPIEYLSDSDRLSQFYEQAGVDMDTLTDSESSRLLDILHALDTGYDFASKQGVSMTAYDGDKANSKKTQRQRLFKKVREASDKAK